MATYRSPPFSENAALVLKVSLDLGANLDLSLFGVTEGERTIDGALAVERQALIGDYGLDPDQFDFPTNGGGAPDSRAAPRALVQFLLEMGQTPVAGAFQSALPVLGVDGSLADTGTTLPGRGFVTAKPGTVIDPAPDDEGLVLVAQNLAGYVETGERPESGLRPDGQQRRTGQRPDRRRRAGARGRSRHLQPRLRVALTGDAGRWSVRDLLGGRVSGRRQAGADPLLLVVDGLTGVLGHEVGDAPTDQRQLALDAHDTDVRARRRAGRGELEGPADAHGGSLGVDAECPRTAPVVRRCRPLIGLDDRLRGGEDLLREPGTSRGTTRWVTSDRAPPSPSVRLTSSTSRCPTASYFARHGVDVGEDLEDGLGRMVVGVGDRELHGLASRVEVAESVEQHLLRARTLAAMVGPERS